MGNIFSYFFNEKTNYDYDDSLLQPLNNNNDIDNKTHYASLIDIESINSQVDILEKTTQNSLRNISKDVQYLFEEVKEIKEYLVRTNPSLTFDNEDNEIDSYLNCNDNDNTSNSNTSNSNTFNGNTFNSNTSNSNTSNSNTSNSNTSNCNTFNSNDNNNNNFINNENDNYSFYVDAESSISEKQKSNVNNSQTNFRSVSFNEKLQVSYLNNGTENMNDFFEDD